MYNRVLFSSFIFSRKQSFLAFELMTFLALFCFLLLPPPASHQISLGPLVMLPPTSWVTSTFTQSSEHCWKRQEIVPWVYNLFIYNLTGSSWFKFAPNHVLSCLQSLFSQFCPSKGLTSSHKWNSTYLFIPCHVGRPQSHIFLTGSKHIFIACWTSYSSILSQRKSCIFCFTRLVRL